MFSMWFLLPAFV